jgi:heptosyltransferase-2
VAARILVIRLSSIGDILLTSPVLRCLAKQFHGGAEIHYLTKEKFREAIEGNPYIARIHTFQVSVQEVLPQLESCGFDYVIDLHRNIRSAIVKKRLKLVSFTFRKQNFRKWCLVNLPGYRTPVRHVVSRYLDTLNAFGIADDGLGLDFPLADAPAQAFRGHYPGQGPYIAWCLGGAHAGKRMAVPAVIDILRHIAHPVVLLGGKAEADMGAEIARAVPSAHNLAGLLSLPESAAALAQSALVVSGDTGMMHLAAALQRPLVSLWGCTTPSLGMAPWRPHADSIMLAPHGRNRRPCSKLGNSCKYGSVRCINRLESGEVAAAIEKRWALQTGP